MNTRRWTMDGRRWPLALGALVMTLAGSTMPARAQQEPAPPAQPAQPLPPTQPGMPAWAQQGQQSPRRGWFGIQLSCDDCFISRGGRVAYSVRPRVSWVEDNSPAYNAGLRAGDTIVTIDGFEITTPEGFERFATALPGQQVRLGLRKAGQEREVLVTPGNNSSSTTVGDYMNQRMITAQRQGIRALQQAFRSPMGWLGLSIECEQCQVSTGSRRQNWVFRQPAAVKMVDVDGPANRAGLRRGDTLLAIDGVDLTTPEGGRAFASVEPNQRVTLTVRRDGRERRVPIVAVTNPDASREEITAFEEYKRTRDSSDALYREAVTASIQRAQLEMRELERQLLTMDQNRTAIDSSRRRLTVIDSLLRSLRAAERRRNEMGFPTSNTFVGSMVAPSMTTPMTPMVSVMPRVAYAGGVYPLRYSDRLGEYNVEARSAGAVNVNQVGDTLLVLQGQGFDVKVQLRPRR